MPRDVDNINHDPLKVARVLPFSVAMRLFDAAQEPLSKVRHDCIRDVVADARRQFPKFFYSPEQAEERERRYEARLKERISRNAAVLADVLNRPV